MGYLLGFMMLAEKAYEAKVPLFPIVSKAHGLDHVFRSLRWQSDISDFAMNPMIYGVQLQEDLIGRSCKLARRVSPRQTVLRTLQRYLEAAHVAWEREGWRLRVWTACLYIVSYLRATSKTEWTHKMLAHSGLLYPWTILDPFKREWDDWQGTQQERCGLCRWENLTFHMVPVML